MTQNPSLGHPGDLDVLIVAAIFHEQNESHGTACTHWNQHLGGKECGRQAIEFIGDYARRWQQEHGDAT